jgi:hypothetical protein
VRYGVSVAASVMITAAGLAMVPVGAQASTGSTLPITNFFQLAADSAQGNLFISQGTADSGILVTNLAGQQKTVLDSQDEVAGLAVSADGSTLYAALPSQDEIAVIDTATLEQTTTYSLGTGNSPEYLAIENGKLWVSYNSSTAGDGAIGDIDPSATSPSLEAQAAMTGWYSAPMLAADPSGSGVLVGYEPYQSPGSVASYDTAVDPATLTTQGSLTCANLNDLVVLPGGSDFVPACVGTTFGQYSTASLSLTSSYTGNAPEGLAVTSDGNLADGSAQYAAIYKSGSDSPVNTFTLPGGDTVSHGVAWAADDSQLYVVMQDYTDSGAVYTLQVINAPALPQTTLTLSGPAKSYITKSIALSGRLTLSAGGTLAAGTPVTVTRSLAGSTSTKSFAETTAANGSFSLTDTPPGPGRYTYTASYQGSASVAPSTAIRAVTVSLFPVSLKLSTGAGTYNYDPTVHVTVQLGTTKTNRTVAIYARQLGSKSQRLLKKGRVNSRGELTVSYKAPHSVTFSAVFAGDARYAATTASRTVQVRAAVGESVRGYYGSQRSGSQTYKLFHRSGKLDLTVTVSPNKRGQCVKVQLEEYYQGTWYSAEGACGYLTKASKASGALKLSSASVGSPYRIRALYVRSASDVSNLSNDGAWVYFMVES